MVNNKGLTLLEMMIALIIMGIITMVMGNQFNYANKQIVALKAATDKAQTLLTQAQSLQANNCGCNSVTLFSSQTINNEDGQTYYAPGHYSGDQDGCE